MKNRKINIFLMVIGTLCIFCSAFLIISTQLEEKEAKDYSNEVVLDFTDHIIPQKHISQTTDEPKEDVDYIKIDDQKYIGILCIPSLSLELPITNTWSYDLLKHTPCTFSGSISNDNLIIAGHNYKVHFGELYKLTDQDEVYILDAYGDVHNYKLEQTETIKGTDLDGLISSDYDLSLFTCESINNSYRTVLRLNKTNKI